MTLFEGIAKDKSEATLLEIKSYLATLVWEEIAKREITQAAAAKLLGVDQPRISDIKQGRIYKFSVDYLIALMVKLGYSFNTEFTPHAKKTKARISVVSGV